MFSCKFCQISKNTFFTEHLWATASVLREGRRLKQIGISIISRLRKENNKKIFFRFLFFTFCAHPFSFRASLFTKRPYVSLYSDFHYVQTCWIWKTHLNTYVKNEKSMLILKFHLGMKCSTSCFLFFIPGWNFIPLFHPRMSSFRDEISSWQKRVNSKRLFITDKDDFNPGRASSGDEISRVNTL